MSDKTRIEWTDATWNPVTGCTKVSEGCDHCYAETIAHRFAGTAAYPDGFAVTLRPERLDQPLRWKRPRRIFVNSMSDLFHSTVPDAYIARVFAVMACASQHTFQVLTKRPGRMRSLLNSEEFRSAVKGAHVFCEKHPMRDWDDLLPVWPLPNVWLGTSIENQKWANVRRVYMRTLHRAGWTTFYSCEPLLGPVVLDLDDFRVDWVIVGGESGPHARPMDPRWARGLRDQCVAAGVPFLFKQAGNVLAREWGGSGKGSDPTRWPEEFPREYPA